MNINFIKDISKGEAKDAFRLAIQSALAGAICYYLMVLILHVDCIKAHVHIRAVYI